MTYVPRLPVERKVVETFTDGLWGLHEYSQWPQRFSTSMPHIACIPSAPCPPSDPEVLFITLSPSRDWVEENSAGFESIGYLQETIRVPLREAASQAVRGFDSARPSGKGLLDHGKLLIIILRQAVDRMEKIPSTAGTAVAVGAHVQRVCLELAGLRIYQQKVLRRLDSATDYSREVLPVLSAFVGDPTTAQTLTRIGVLTWLIQPLTHSLVVWEVVESRYPTTFHSNDKPAGPGYQNPNVVGSVLNMTGDWLSSMAVTISKIVCGSRLSKLSRETQSALRPEPAAPDSEPSAKRQRVPGSHGKSRHLVQTAQPAPDEATSIKRKKKKKTRLHTPCLEMGRYLRQHCRSGQEQAARPRCSPQRQLHHDHTIHPLSTR